MHFAFAFPVLVILVAIGYAFYRFVVKPKTTVKAGLTDLETTAKADAAKVEAAVTTEFKVAEKVADEVKSEVIKKADAAAAEVKSIL